MIRFEKMNAEERLKEYIERDEIYQDYKKDKLMNPSDFEIFCIQHCKDIEEILEENQELKKQLEIGEQQYNDLVEEKEKLDAENQVLKDYKNVALTYMKNYLKMELNYQNKDVAEHFKMVIDMLNRGNKHGNLVDITDCETQQKEFKIIYKKN